MTLPLVFRSEVQADLDTAYIWYEQQASGLGDQFLQAVNVKLESVRINPEAFGVIHQNVRAALVQRFPYVIYFRLEADRITVVAVQHGRQHSRRWQSRVDG